MECLHQWVWPAIIERLRKTSHQVMTKDQSMCASVHLVMHFDMQK